MLGLIQSGHSSPTTARVTKFTATQSPTFGTFSMEEDDDSVGSAAFGIESSATSFLEPGGALRAPPRHVLLELDDNDGDLHEDPSGAARARLGDAASELPFPVGRWVRDAHPVKVKSNHTIGGSGADGVVVDVRGGWRTILCADGTEMKRRCTSLCPAPGAPPSTLIAEAANFAKRRPMRAPSPPPPPPPPPQGWMAVGDRVAYNGRSGVIAALPSTHVVKASGRARVSRGTWWKVRLDGEDELRNVRRCELVVLPPPMASSDPGWCRATDASTGRAYFWHPTTGEARWTLDDSESVRFDQATRASDPAKGLLHYQNRLKKAVRLVKFAKIDRFRRKISKYRAIRGGAPRSRATRTIIFASEPQGVSTPAAAPEKCLACNGHHVRHTCGKKVVCRHCGTQKRHGNSKCPNDACARSRQQVQPVIVEGRRRSRGRDVLAPLIVRDDDPCTRCGRSPPAVAFERFARGGRQKTCMACKVRYPSQLRNRVAALLRAMVSE